MESCFPKASALSFYVARLFRTAEILTFSRLAVNLQGRLQERLLSIFVSTFLQRKPSDK